MSNAGRLTLEWFGCTTFRLHVGGLTLMLDAYVTKVPGAAPQGMSAADVPEADFVFISHAHFDHMVDAADIAVRTGAAVVGNYEAIQVLRAAGVPDGQLLPASGGETVECGDGVNVRVLPGLHSCLFASSDTDSGASCLGDLGVSLQSRRAALRRLFEGIPQALPDIAEYFEQIAPHCSTDDGGQLTYLIDTPAGSILFNASSGYWRGIMSDVRADIALMALTGRPNVDGEPFQGSLADFLLGQVQMVRPSELILCHHDALLPPVTPPVDVGPALARIAEAAPYTKHRELRLREPVTLRS
jgi:L-ascorbate metabolism protein UlaG (beta-lactamase superfamily)